MEEKSLLPLLGLLSYSLPSSSSSSSKFSKRSTPLLYWPLDQNMLYFGAMMTHSSVSTNPILRRRQCHESYSAPSEIYISFWYNSLKVPINLFYCIRLSLSSVTASYWFSYIYHKIVLGQWWRSDTVSGLFVFLWYLCSVSFKSLSKRSPYFL